MPATPGLPSTPEARTASQQEPHKIETLELAGNNRASACWEKYGVAEELSLRVQFCVSCDIGQ